jgi:hypothetical protein
MTAAWILAVLIVGVAVFVRTLRYSRRALLAWYLREVQKVEVAEQPDERIVSYPLA